MLTEEQIDQGTGEITRRPLAPLYAATLAGALNWRCIYDDGARRSYAPADTTDKIAKGDYYAPRLNGNPVDFKLYLTKTLLHIFFMDEPTSGDARISALMLGDGLREEDLELILSAITPLPYGTAVAGAIIDKADWLDENPMYRGLPRIAQRGLSVDQLEVGKQVEKPENWDW